MGWTSGKGLLCIGAGGWFQGAGGWFEAAENSARTQALPVPGRIPEETHVSTGMGVHTTQ